MSASIGGSGHVPDPYNSYQTQQAKLPLDQGASLEIDGSDEEFQSSSKDSIVGKLNDGQVCYVDAQGDYYILKETKPSQFQKEYIDQFGTYSKNEAGIKFTVSKGTAYAFCSDDKGNRIYDNGSVNAYGDLPQTDEYGREYFRDAQDEIYYLDNNKGRVFYDKNMGEYFKDLLGNRFEYRETDKGKEIAGFTFNEAYDRVASDAKLVLQPRDIKNVAEDMQKPALKSIQNANAPGGGKDLKSIKSSDISDEVKKKVQEYNQDEALVAEIDALKKHEAEVDRKNVVIGIAVGVLAVAALVAIVASGGIAGGIIGAVAAGVMAGHQGIHHGTRAPENQSKEAVKAKGRMEDVIETDSDFLRNLKIDDEKRGVKRNFSLLSESVKVKAEKTYEEIEVGSQIEGMLYDLKDIGDPNDFDYTLEPDDPETAKKMKKEKDELFPDIDDEIYNS